MKFNESAGLLGFIDTNVVHKHSLWENGGWVRRAGPNAADGDVENDVKRMVENPFHPGGKPRRRERRIKLLINKEAKDSWFPFDRKHMEVVVEVYTAGK